MGQPRGREVQGDTKVEEALFRAFIEPVQRRRYVARLATGKTRQKLLGDFYHNYALDPRYATRIEPRAQHPDAIYALLRQCGAPQQCYVMSASSDLDGQTADLRQALDKLVWWCPGTFVSCIPGRLAYFEGEEPNERYVLQRPADKVVS